MGMGTKRAACLLLLVTAAALLAMVHDSFLRGGAAPEQWPRSVRSSAPGGRGNYNYPNGYVYGCYDVSKGLPFCDSKLSVDQRLDDLMSRMSTEEKMYFLGGDTKNTKIDACTNMDGGLLRLGIPRELNLVETNSAVEGYCLDNNLCTTEFPGPMNMAATFNQTLWRKKGEVISTEMRALNNLNWYRSVEAPYSLIGLSGFGPNINIARDPRFGRISELPGEDPYLSGVYAREYVRGQQEGEDPRFAKMIAGLKHYACYSVENGREYRSFAVSTFDFWDSYLPQYQMAFVEGNALQVMCSYASENGVPSCASDFLLNQVVRKKWNRTDVVVSTDCGAISNMQYHNKYAKDATDAAAKSINGGSDIDLGDMYFPASSIGGNGALQDALSKKQTSLAQINASLRRVLKRRFITGQFDPIEDQPYADLSKYGRSQVNSSDSWALMLDAALQSLVLLKNGNGLLPLRQGSKIAVVGPQSFAQRDMLEDYAGRTCHSGSFDCVQTIAGMIAAYNAKGQTLVAKGVDVDSKDTSGIPEALYAVQQSDYVVLVLGDGYGQEHETLDRTSISLPGQQEFLAKQVLGLHKPTILVIVSYGQIAIDNLMDVDALIQAFCSGMRGAEAIARGIFGLDNRWGKLPVTIYPANYVNQVDMYSFDMTKSPGRTYRYYTGQPLFAFGQGLSLTTFNMSCSIVSKVYLSCTIGNSGQRDGDEVIMIYHNVSQQIKHAVNHPVPLKQLVAFERVFVPKQQTKTVQFTIKDEQLKVTDNNGNYVLYAGTHYITVSRGNADDKLFQYYVSTTEVLSENPKPE